eukprot:CAMPEP_0183833892 /NCGR_PEP_ID=MMETSP0807_2-20130328/6318_1 /TAXON_ID=88271 /ORGANISM="Picocystis salinarum, Strain CCMP1897" /LENGTH=319 /DNA_ID=CAMNT_0026079875 /DNA_START=27 /DNA_END=984 /DNA_ORIENTATION=-
MNWAPALHCPSLAIQEVVPHLGQTFVGGIRMGHKPAGHFAILHLSFTCIFIAHCQEVVREEPPRLDLGSQCCDPSRAHRPRRRNVDTHEDDFEQLLVDVWDAWIAAIRRRIELHYAIVVVPHLGQTFVGGIRMGHKPAGHFAILHLSFTCIFIAHCQEVVRAVSIMAMHMYRSAGKFDKHVVPPPAANRASTYKNLLGWTSDPSVVILPEPIVHAVATCSFVEHLVSSASITVVSMRIPPLVEYPFVCVDVVRASLPSPSTSSFLHPYASVPVAAASFFPFFPPIFSRSLVSFVTHVDTHEDDFEQLLVDVWDAWIAAI